jgi:hypothetical protein
MALTLTGLTAYVNQNADKIKALPILEAKIIKNKQIGTLFGVAGTSVALNNLKTTPVGSNTTCGSFGDAGSQVLSQVTVTMKPAKFEFSYCADDLKQYFTSEEMKADYNSEDLGSLEEIFVSDVLNKTALEIEKIIVRGDTAAGVGNLALADGLIKNLGAVSASTFANITYTALTAGNAQVCLQSIVAQIPESIIETAVVYLSPKDFASVRMAYATANYYNFADPKTVIDELLIYGSNTKVRSVAGLSSANAYLVSDPENFVAVFGGNDDMEMKAWYDNETEKVKIRIKTKLGAGIRFPELVVRSK